MNLRRVSAFQGSLKQETGNERISTDKCVVSCDLHQALHIPNLTVDLALYLRKAWVYNLGLHSGYTVKF